MIYSDYVYGRMSKESNTMYYYEEFNPWPKICLGLYFDIQCKGVFQIGGTRAVFNEQVQLFIFLTND